MKSIGKLVSRLNTWKRRQRLASRRVNQIKQREAEIERLEKKAGTLQGMLDTSLELEKTYCDSFGKVQAERDEAVILLQAFAGADDWELKPAIDAEDFLARIRAGEQPQQGGE